MGVKAIIVETEAIIREKRTEKRSYEIMSIMTVNGVNIRQNVMENRSHLHDG